MYSLLASEAERMRVKEYKWLPYYNYFISRFCSVPGNVASSPSLLHHTDILFFGEKVYKNVFVVGVERRLNEIYAHMAHG